LTRFARSCSSSSRRPRGSTEGYAASATSYVQEFFAVRADPKKVERAFRAGCKN
jgi:hypothetical protein